MEIINKILEYVSELNNNIIITQYHALINKEYYRINFKSDFLWKIKSTLVMKRLYPVYPGYYANFNNKDTIRLYQFGIPNYEKQLRRNMIT